MEQNEKKAVPHLKAWGDWLVMFQDLDDAQFGRLMRAAISYVCAGVEPDMSEWAKEDRLPFNILRPVLDKNRGNYLEKVRKNTENGAKGAAARWGTDGERHTENGERYLTNGENSQEEEKEEDQREKKEEKREITEEKGVIGEEDEKIIREKLQTAWRKYNKMRGEKGQPVTDEDLTAIKANLEKYSDGDISRAAVLLENAADKGWMNVFPDDEAKGKSRQVNRTVKNLERGMAL